ncbi:MAG: heme exporter protein CcmB [Leptolinea sp.]
MKKVHGFFRVVGAVVWKDLATEFRSRELISAMLVFALLVILIFNFALELSPQNRVGLTSGILWVTLIFAGTIGLNRSMAVEKDRGCLDGLLLAPVDRTAIYFGKVLANWLFTMLVAVIIMPLYAVLYSVNLFVPGLFLSILLGTAGYSVVGTLLAAMAVQTRTRDILLPILLFPVIFPLLLAVVKASSGFLQTLPWVDIQPWMTLLVVYDMIFIAIGILVFDSVVEE